MTADVDIANRALSEIGARTVISSLAETSPAAVQCRLFYNTLREQLLRTAPWGFARKTLTLTTLGLATDTPPTAPYPWLVKYAYPADCLKVRYILPPPFVTSDTAPNVSSGLVTPWCGPSRQWRFLKSYDDTVSPARTVLLSNVLSALCVYTVNVTDPDLFDPLFTNALTMLLADKLVIPLSGNVGMKESYVKLAMMAVTDARVADGNESITTSDHVVDWIATRGVGSVNNGFGSLGVGGVDWGSMGQWYGGNDSAGWSM